jgi:hypothetical protein
LLLSGGPVVAVLCWVPVWLELLKKSEGTLYPADSVSVIQPSCFVLYTLAWLLFSYFKWTMLAVKVSMFHLQCIILS